VRLHGGGPATFTLMLSCLGAGAIVAALYFPRWRARYSRDQFVRIGTLVHSRAVGAGRAAVPQLWVAAAGDGAGGAWPGSRWPTR
jgi:hypothetical protein